TTNQCQTSPLPRTLAHRSGVPVPGWLCDGCLCCVSEYQVGGGWFVFFFGKCAAWLVAHGGADDRRAICGHRWWCDPGFDEHVAQSRSEDDQQCLHRAFPGDASADTDHLLV